MTASSQLGGKRIIALVIAAAFFVEHLDSSVLNTALPVIAVILDVPVISLSAAVTCYLLAVATFVPVSGWLADRFGTRRIFIVALLVFGLGSILCGAAQSLGWLVAGRIVQGMGGALMVPVGRIILLRSFDKAQLVAAMSYVTIPALLGPVLGPLVGGAIATYANWRWIFFLNLPFVLLGIVLALRHLPPDGAGERRQFDALGYTGFAISLILLVGGLELIGKDFVPGWTISLAIAGGLGLLAATLAWCRQRGSRAIIDLEIFRLKTFRIGQLGGLICRIGFGGTPFILPLYLQLGHGYSAIESGSQTFIIGIGAMLLKTVATRLLRGFGFRHILIVNGLLTAGMTWALLLIDAATPYFLLLGGLAVFGFFRSLQFTSMNALSFSDLPPAAASGASAISSVLQQVSQTLGVALMAGVLAAGMVASGTGTPSLTHFALAIGLSGLLPALSVLAFARLGPGDGAAVSGHGRAP